MGLGGFLKTAGRVTLAAGTGGLSEVAIRGKDWLKGGEAPQAEQYMSNAWDSEPLTPEQEANLAKLMEKTPPHLRQRLLGALRLNMQKQNYEQRAVKEREARAGYEKQMQDRYNELRGPMDPNNPAVAAGLSAAQNAASRDASNRGINGPMAVANTQQAYSNAWNQMDFQRQQQANQMLGGLGNYSLGRFGTESRVAADQRDFDYNRFLQASQAYEQGQAAKWSAVTGLLGAAGGGYLGGPKGAAAGGQAGAGLGGGLAAGHYGGKVGY